MPKSDKLLALQTFVHDSRPLQNLRDFLSAVRGGQIDSSIKGEKLDKDDDVTCGVIELYVRVQLLRSGLLDEFGDTGQNTINKAMEITIRTCQKGFFGNNEVPDARQAFVATIQNLRAAQA